MFGIDRNLIVIGALALAVLGGVAWVWSTATNHAELKEAVADANDATASTRANARQLDGASRASDQHARDAIVLHGEANAGREEIARARRTPPAPGTVGADARIDPALGQRVLCRIERVRRQAASEPCRAASVSDQ